MIGGIFPYAKVAYFVRHGVVASLAVTEFMMLATGIREPVAYLIY